MKSIAERRTDRGSNFIGPQWDGGLHVRDRRSGEQSISAAPKNLFDVCPVQLYYSYRRNTDE
jgi:hypothetical protein